MQAHFMSKMCVEVCCFCVVSLYCSAGLLLRLEPDCPAAKSLNQRAFQNWPCCNISVYLAACCIRLSEAFLARLTGAMSPTLPSSKQPTAASRLLEIAAFQCIGILFSQQHFQESRQPVPSKHPLLYTSTAQEASCAMDVQSTTAL